MFTFKTRKNHTLHFTSVVDAALAMSAIVHNDCHKVGKLEYIGEEVRFTIEATKREWKKIHKELMEVNGYVYEVI